MDTPIIFWILFNAFVLLMLALDLGVFHRDAKSEKTQSRIRYIS